MRIVFASAEVSPFAKTGGLGDVCGALPKALSQLGQDVVVFMPYYRAAKRYFDKSGTASPERLFERRITWANWTEHAVFHGSRLPGSRVQVIFVENDGFFDRDGIYDGADQLERYAFFCRAVIAGCEAIGKRVDILHAHDWHTALLPVYLETGLRIVPVFRDTASVYTIHNLNYVGSFSADHFPTTGLHSSVWSANGVEYFGNLHLMKGGINFANEVTTVSPTYAKEIQTPEYGAGVDGVLRQHKAKLVGILNGIDPEVWNPASDPHLPAHYRADDLHGKTRCKEALLDEAGLPRRGRTPLIGAVSRLVEQKGFDLLIPAFPKLLAAGAQFVILGTGEPWLEAALAEEAQRYPDAVKMWNSFDDALAHRIFAGSDLVLVPSRYEPCGLNQMYALRYGTPPIVRMTGGLADTVVPYDGANAAAANGFGFTPPDANHLYLTTRIAALTYRDHAVWPALVQNGMRADYSWEMSARHYVDAYRRARGEAEDDEENGVEVDDFVSS